MAKRSMSMRLETTTAMKKRRRVGATRKPVYCDIPTKRITSVPNGMWQVQVRMDEKGTRERSNWLDIHAPQSNKDAAMQMMHNRCVVVPENMSV